MRNLNKTATSVSNDVLAGLTEFSDELYDSTRKNTQIDRSHVQKGGVEVMRLLLSIAAFGMLSLSTSASAYLSRDGERLADGKGNCKVCPTGWRPTAAGNYDCGSPVTSESNCRPAVANVKPRVPVAYDADGRIVETRKKQQ